MPLAALAALLGTSSVALAVPVGHTALHQAQAPEKPHELQTDQVHMVALMLLGMDEGGHWLWLGEAS